MKYVIPALAAVVVILIAVIFGLTVRAFVAISTLWGDNRV